VAADAAADRCRKERRENRGMQESSDERSLAETG